MKKNKKEIITEVTFLLSLKKGFDNVSIKEIQKGSGFAAGSIYYYFQDKNEILLKMISVYLVDNFYEYREAIRNFDGSFIEKIESIFYYLLGFNKKEFDSIHGATVSECDNNEYFGLFSSIFHQHPETRPLFYELHKESFSFYQELVEEAIENKEIKEDIDVKSMTICIHTVLKGYLDLCIYLPDLAIEDLVNANLKMIEEMAKK